MRRALLVTVLGMAGMERRFIVERQRAGIEAAKKKDVYKGRKASVPIDVVRRMRDEGKGRRLRSPTRWPCPV
jgi:DNA invertase Pin-like site-specific DNA recombinase